VSLKTEERELRVAAALRRSTRCDRHLTKDCRDENCYRPRRRRGRQFQSPQVQQVSQPPQVPQKRSRPRSLNLEKLKSPTKETL